MIARLFFLSLFCISLLAESSWKEESGADVDVAELSEELFSYHVEFSNLNPLLVRRLFKIYIHNFDSKKQYLLKEEVLPFLELSENKVEKILDDYGMNQFTEIEKMDALFVQSIFRARKIRESLRKEVEEELLLSKNVAWSDKESMQFSLNEAELTARLKRQMMRFCLKEKNRYPAPFTAEYAAEIIDFFTGKVEMLEQHYLQQGKQSQDFFKMRILKALAKSLDAHTAVYTKQEAMEARTSLEKQTQGIGVFLQECARGIEIVGLTKDGPAQRSGSIHKGDWIVAINGQSVKKLGYPKSLQLMKGKETEFLELLLCRWDTKGSVSSHKVSLQVEPIVLEEERISWTFEPFADGIIGSIFIPSFYENQGKFSCESDLKEALKALKKEGKLHGLVIDIRDNLGGFLSQAVKMVSMFISSGVVVVSKYANSQVHYLRSIDPRLYYTGPLLILTSKMSASAAEILSQALQDYGVALVAGDQSTFGKGTSQYQTLTDRNARHFYKVTLGRYYTVSGRSTQIDGVIPDLYVPSEFNLYKIGERYLEYALHPDRISAAYADTINDVDTKGKLWLQKNYLPFLQKKESRWQEMLPVLKENVAKRIDANEEYKRFLHSPYVKRQDRLSDPPLREAIDIVKDMYQMAQDQE